MQELRTFWRSRTLQQRILILGGFVASLLLTFAFVAFAGKTPKSLLYAGLEDANAAPVVAYLDQNGIAYELKGGAIWIDRSQRDRARMELAAQNLPRQGGAGYEILDQMSGFSTTSQMFDAAYWRAKEGELARTILSLPSVQSARVHLTAPQTRGYREKQPGSASVTVVTDGRSVNASQAKAMRHLISSAVPFLDPGAVSVIDSQRGVVQPQDEQSGTDRETRMKENVERILAPHVGAGNAIVEVSIALITQSEHLLERSFDPTQRAIISEQTEELTDESSTAETDAVTAASNLPEQGDQQGDRQQSQRAETRQSANYEVGSVTREIQRRPGDIKRLSVAVLVNGVPGETSDGNPQLVPRSQEELEVIHDLVAAAVGYDESRADEIVVRSMPFTASSQSGTQAARSEGWVDRLHLDALARLVVIGLFAVIALALATRTMRAGKATPVTAALDQSLPPLAASHTEENVDDVMQVGPENTSLPMISMASPDFDFDTSATPADDPVSRLKRLMKERQDETVRVLNGWIGEDERSAS